MFEGLDQIDWKNVGYHVWGKSEDYLQEIPQKIKELRSPDEDIQDQAMGYVFGEKAAFGTVCDTTPYIIPFVIELVADTKTPRREYLFDYVIQESSYVLSSEYLSAHEMRLYLSVYDSIAKHLNILIGFLDDKDRNIRLAAVRLLGNLTDEAETLLPEFFKRFDLTEDEEMQVGLLNGVKVLLGALDAWKQREIKEAYAPVLKDIVDSNSSQKVQLAAARASVETINRSRRDLDVLSERVPNLLIQEFLQKSGGDRLVHWEYVLEHSTLIIMDLAQIGPEPFLELLQNHETTAIKAHLIVRGLLISILVPYKNDFYSKSNLSHTKLGIYYLQDNRLSDYRVLVRRNDKADLLKKALKAMLENPNVWDLPTNMFSYFFGMPDSREEIQEILTYLSSKE